GRREWPRWCDERQWPRYDGLLVRVPLPTRSVSCMEVCHVLRPNPACSVCRRSAARARCLRASTDRLEQACVSAARREVDPLRRDLEERGPERLGGDQANAHLPQHHGEWTW